MRSRKPINEEIQVGDNKGLPEGYPREAQARARQRLGIVGQGARQAGRYGLEIMRDLELSRRLCRGHERELEALATKVVTDLYKPILDFHNIKLDIKMVSGSEIRRMIDAGTAAAFKPYGKGETPVIKARGQDFSMLIHEAVKGLWLLMSELGVPGGEARNPLLKKFSLSEDEPEEWAYGPEIAGDLRDFILENPLLHAQEGGADKYPNLREFVWMHMVNKDTMPAGEFVDLMKGILSKTKEARKKVDSIIKEVAEMIDAERQYERELAEWESEYGHLQGEPEEEVGKGPEEDLDYSLMDQKTLQDHLDRALEAGDRELVRTIARYLD